MLINPEVMFAASDRLFAVVAVPERLPINVGEDTVPINLPVPATSNLNCGIVDPTPTFPFK